MRSKTCFWTQTKGEGLPVTQGTKARRLWNPFPGLALSSLLSRWEPEPLHPRNPATLPRVLSAPGFSSPRNPQKQSPGHKV